MSKLVELKLKQQALKKKMDAIGAEMDLIYFEMDEEIEKQYDSTSAYVEHYELNKEFVLSDEDLHKLLCLINHTVIPSNEGMDESDRKSLYNFMEYLQWNVAEHIGVDINKGEIDPRTYTFKPFEGSYSE